MQRSFTRFSTARGSGAEDAVVADPSPHCPSPAQFRPFGSLSHTLLLSLSLSLSLFSRPEHRTPQLWSATPTAYEQRTTTIDHGLYPPFYRLHGPADIKETPRTQVDSPCVVLPFEVLPRRTFFHLFFSYPRIPQC